MIRRIIMLFAIQAVLVGGLHAAAADEKEPTIARGYTLKVKAGHEAEFEAGMKKQIKWYKDNKETWQWHTWQLETGENTGQYVFRSPGHFWKDLDDRSERTARAKAHFEEAVRLRLDLEVEPVLDGARGVAAEFWRVDSPSSVIRLRVQFSTEIEGQ